MSPEREWGKIYHCFTCKKGLNEEQFNQHKLLNHNADSYISMPKEVIIPEKPVKNTSYTKSNKTFEEIKRDYADVEEVTEDWEIGQ